MEIKGEIKRILDTKIVSDKFKNRALHLETADQYSQTIEVVFTQDKTAVLDSYKVGDVVTIGINLKGREWTNPQGEIKVFNTVEAWKITKDESSPKTEDAPF
jgi:ABC-type antimicrobial peptide transport system ATPase subunit